MEKKNPLPPHYPEQESFEEYTNPDPNEITPQQYDNRDGNAQGRQSGNNVARKDKDKKTREGRITELDKTEDVIDDEDEMMDGYSNQSDDENEGMLEEEDEESKSSLRPIDANKSPEEWRKLPQNHPLKVKDKKD